MDGREQSMGRKQPTAWRIKVIKSGSRDKFLFRYWNPIQGRWMEETSDVPAADRNRAKAVKAAGEREKQLASQRAASGSWIEFETRYRTEWLSGLAPGSVSNWKSVASSLEKFAASLRPVVKLESLDQITADFLSRWVAWMRGKVSEDTIKSRLGTLRAAINWAARVGLMREAPKFPMPPRVKRSKMGRKKMRSRPVTGEEFDRLLDATPKVRKRNPEIWRRFIRGLWLSGLRVGEGVSLSWDWTADFSVDLDKCCFRILSEGEKGNEDRYTPMTPDFVAFLRETPEEQRMGLVFGLRVTKNQASRVIGRIGEKAGIKVSNKGRTASAHDLRRSFGTRWAPRVHPTILQQLMRHADLTTTMSYYVDLDPAAIAKQLQLGGNSGETTNHPKDRQIVKERRKPKPAK